MQPAERHRQYWRKNLRMTALLLSVWFIATFGVSWYARELQSITVLGFPLPFYMGAQGALLIYLLLVGCYAWRMDRLNREFGAPEDDAP